MADFVPSDRLLQKAYCAVPEHNNFLLINYRQFFWLKEIIMFFSFFQLLAQLQEVSVIIKVLDINLRINFSINLLL